MYMYVYVCICIMIASDSTPKKLKSVSPVNKPESPAYLKYPSVTLSPQSPGAVTNSVLQRSLKVVPRPKQGHKRCKGRPTSQERTLSLTSLWLKDLKRPAAPATGSLSLRCFGWTRQCPWFPRPQRLTTRCLRGSAINNITITKHHHQHHQFMSTRQLRPNWRYRITN